MGIDINKKLLDNLNASEKEAVLSILKEYQEKVRTILKNMAEAAITPAAVRMTLSDLVQNNLISTDYANYYVQYNRQYRERHTGK